MPKMICRVEIAHSYVKFRRKDQFVCYFNFNACHDLPLQKSPPAGADSECSSSPFIKEGLPTGIENCGLPDIVV